MGDAERSIKSGIQLKPPPVKVLSRPATKSLTFLYVLCKCSVTAVKFGVSSGEKNCASSRSTATSRFELCVCIIFWTASLSSRALETGVALDEVTLVEREVI